MNLFCTVSGLPHHINEDRYYQERSAYPRERIHPHVPVGTRIERGDVAVEIFRIHRTSHDPNTCLALYGEIVPERLEGDDLHIGPDLQPEFGLIGGIAGDAVVGEYHDIRAVLLNDLREIPLVGGSLLSRIDGYRIPAGGEKHGGRQRAYVPHLELPSGERHVELLPFLSNGVGVQFRLDVLAGLVHVGYFGGHRTCGDTGDVAQEIDDGIVIDNVPPCEDPESLVLEELDETACDEIRVGTGDDDHILRLVESSRIGCIYDFVFQLCHTGRVNVTSGCCLPFGYELSELIEDGLGVLLGIRIRNYDLISCIQLYHRRGQSRAYGDDVVHGTVEIQCVPVIVGDIERFVAFSIGIRCADGQ